jgi:hypothetical protein
MPAFVWTEETHDNLSEDSECLRRDCNWAHPKHKLEALVLYQPNHFRYFKTLFLSKKHRSRLFMRLFIYLCNIDNEQKRTVSPGIWLLSVATSRYVPAEVLESAL